MNSIKRIVKESSVIYLILAIVFFTTVISKMAAITTTNMMPLGTGLFYAIILFLGISVGVIGITLINNFKLALVFNRNRNNIVYDSFKYIGFVSVISSIIINFWGLILHYLPENPLAPFIFGMNFNILSRLPIRLIIVSIVFISIGTLGLYLSSTFCVHGTLNGISAIILTITLLMSLSMKIINGLLWAEQLPLLLVLILIITSVLLKITQLTLLRFENH